MFNPRNSHRDLRGPLCPRLVSSLVAAMALAGSACSSGGSQQGGDAAGDAASDAVASAVQTCRPFADPAMAPSSLRETGCTDPSDPRRPSAALVPYEINSALWSDGAEKERFIALPEGGRIHVADCARSPGDCADPETGATEKDRGDWIFPVGTVLVKHFDFGGRRIETRLFARTSASAWYGYSYAWREDGRDADLLPDGGDRMLTGPNGPQRWHFPSGSECLQCHTAGAGRSLGPETKQLDRVGRHTEGKNQLVAMAAAGLFDPVSTPALGAPLTDPTDSAQPLDARARAYLHANCANCHRPRGAFAAIDLRDGIPFGDMNLCNSAPERTHSGPTDALRLVPGDPSRSVLSIRMHSRKEDQMPPIGTTVVDPVGTKLIDDWIRTIARCP